MMAALIACSALAKDPTPESIDVVSLVQLIAFPERYERRLVSVYGYLEQGALYLTHHHVTDGASLVFIADTDRQPIEEACGERYVQVMGRVNTDRGASTLTDVEFVERPDRMYRCWEREPQ